MIENKEKILEKGNRKKIIKQAHGDRIRLIIKQEGLTQETLAELLEIDVKTLSRVENGDSFLRGEAAIRLYLEYGYSLDWIYGLSQIPKDEDKIYHVDIRDIVQIENKHVNISIKKYLFDLLANASESESIKELGANEDTIRLIKGISKQKRLLTYSDNKREFCCTSISADQFTVKTGSDET